MVCGVVGRVLIRVCVFQEDVGAIAWQRDRARPPQVRRPACFTDSFVLDF